MDFKAEYLAAMRRHVPKYLTALLRSGRLAGHLRQRNQEANDLLEQLLQNDPHPTTAEQREGEEIVRAVFINVDELKAESAAFLDEQEIADDFPLTPAEAESLHSIADLIRSELATLTPRQLRSVAAFLLALGRLPRRTAGIAVDLSFSQPTTDGNYGWVTMSISEDEIRLENGEHFYDAGVGGDTQCTTLFESIAAGTYSEGDIQDWLEYAQARSQDGSFKVDDDNSSYDTIDWFDDDE